MKLILPSAPRLLGEHRTEMKVSKIQLCLEYQLSPAAEQTILSFPLPQSFHLENEDICICAVGACAVHFNQQMFIKIISGGKSM